MTTEHRVNRDHLMGAMNSFLGAETGAAACQMTDSDSIRREPTIKTVVEVPATRNFSDALQHAMFGSRITRAGWNAGGQHVEAQYPDKGSRMSTPYLVLKNAQNELVPWVPSQGDLFASDWALLP